MFSLQAPSQSDTHQPKLNAQTLFAFGVSYHDLFSSPQKARPVSRIPKYLAFAEKPTKYSLSLEAAASDYNPFSSFVQADAFSNAFSDATRMRNLQGTS